MRAEGSRQKEGRKIVNLDNRNVKLILTPSLVFQTRARKLTIE